MTILCFTQYLNTNFELMKQEIKKIQMLKKNRTLDVNFLKNILFQENSHDFRWKELVASASFVLYHAFDYYGGHSSNRENNCKI